MSETNNPASSNDKKPVVFAVPSSSTRRGINAVHVNSAREMVRLHTQGRNPPAARQATCPLFQAEQWKLLMLQRKSYRLNAIQVPQHSDSITSR